jgi:hypothetical protein
VPSLKHWAAHVQKPPDKEYRPPKGKDRERSPKKVLIHGRLSFSAPQTRLAAPPDAIDASMDESMPDISIASARSTGAVVLPAGAADAGVEAREEA